MGNERTKECSGRTLHVVDVENLAGGPRAGADEVMAAVAAYKHEVPVAIGDHAVIACNANNGAMVFAAEEAWTGSCLVKVGHGADGADNVLLAECDPDRLATNYSRVVIGSGDHAFVPLVHALRARGVAVIVVSRERALCGELGRVACVCHRLPDHEPLVPAAA